MLLKIDVKPEDIIYNKGGRIIVKVHHYSQFANGAHLCTVNGNTVAEFKPIAERMVSAEKSFCELVIDRIGCTKEEAEKVLSVYLKEKIAKMDAVNGKITLKHGIFWENDILKNAINGDDFEKSVLVSQIKEAIQTIINLRDEIKRRS
jgi:hypothetical protein